MTPSQLRRRINQHVRGSRLVRAATFGYYLRSGSAKRRYFCSCCGGFIDSDCARYPETNHAAFACLAHARECAKVARAQRIYTRIMRSQISAQVAA